MERYESLGLVGEGSYGTVLKCRHKESGRLVAIKKFMDSDDDKTVKKIALREIKLLRQLRHDNLVNLLEVWKRRRRWYLVFEFVERTLLDDLEQKPNGLDLNTSRQHLYQILRAVAFCHQQNIIHRDIKPENILISQGDVVKLCDFGFARTMATPADGGAYTDYVATRWYRAPELLVGDTKYGKPVDVWAVGCLLLEMLTGQPLFPGDSDLDQIYHIVRCFGNLTAHHQELFYRNPVFSGVRLPQCSSKVPLEQRFPSVATNALDVAQSCLQMDPESRAHCSELLEHALFTEDSFNIRFLDELNAKIQKDHRENSTFPKIAKTQRRDEDNVNDKDQRRKDKKQSEDTEVKVKKEKDKGDKDDKDKFTKTKAKQPPKPKHIHNTSGPSMSNKQSKTQCAEKMAKIDRSQIITRGKPGKASGVELKMEPGISIPSKTYTSELFEASKTATYLNNTADIKHRNGEVASVEPRESKLKQADTKEIGFTGVLSSYSDNSVPRVAEKSMKEIQNQSKLEPVQDLRKSKNSNAKAAKISNCSTTNHTIKTTSSKPSLGSVISCSESKSTQKMSKISSLENSDRAGTATSYKISDTDQKSISTKVVKVSTPVIPSVTKQHKTTTSKHQRDCSDMDTEQRSTGESVKVLPPTTKSFTTISKSGFRNTKENTNVPDSPLKNLTTDPSVQSSVVFIEGNLAHSVTSITGSSLNAKPPNTAIRGLDESQTDLQANRDLEVLITTASQQDSTTSREDIRGNCGWSSMSSVINTAAKHNETDDVLSVDYEENPGYNGSSGIHQQITTKSKVTKESRTSTSSLNGITKFKTPVGTFVPETLKTADKENREDLALSETIRPTTQSPQVDPQASNPKQTELNMKFLQSPHIEFLTREPKAKPGSFGKPSKSPMTVTAKTQKPIFPPEDKNERDDTEGDRGLSGLAFSDSALYTSSANPDHNASAQTLYDIHTANANDCTLSASYSSPPPPPPPPSSTPQLLPPSSMLLIPSISVVGATKPNSSNQFTVGMGPQSGTNNLRCTDKPKYRSGIYSRLTHQAVTGPQANQMPEKSPICEHSLSERCNLGDSSGGSVPRKKSDIYFPDVRHSVLPELKGRDGKQHTKGPSKDQRKDKQPVQAVHPSDQQKLGSNSTDTKTH